MSRPVRNWKDTFRRGMYACPELRKRKIHRDLLGYLVHAAHQKTRYCWPSQSELASVCECSVRNVHDLVDYLHSLGAIFPVRYADLPESIREVIKSLTPGKVTRNANAYLLCVNWAEDRYAAAHLVAAPTPSTINVSMEARAEGRDKANDRRRRKAPFEGIADTLIDVHPDHDEWQFMNAVDFETGSGNSAHETGSPTSVFEMAETGSGATDRTTEYNPAAFSVPNNAGSSASDFPFREQENHRQNPSALSVRRTVSPPEANSGGNAVASDPSPPGLARPEGTEYDAVRARVGAGASGGVSQQRRKA